MKNVTRSNFLANNSTPPFYSHFLEDLDVLEADVEVSKKQS